MGYKHLDSVNMNADHTSAVIPFKDKEGFAGKKTGFVIISWAGATGTLDGTVAMKIVEPANDAGTVNHAAVTISTKTLDAASGSYRWDITAPIENIQFVWTKNNCTAGTLKVSLYTNPVGR